MGARITSPSMESAPMNRAAALYRSAIFKKAIMAITGMVLFGFVLSHMTGNLKIFQGAEKINHYSEFLREFGQPVLPYKGFLWIMRLGLIGAAVLHIWSAIALTLDNRRARPKNYELRRPVQMDYASRTMRYSGFIVAGYIVYHLLHLTSGQAHPDFVHGDVYSNLIIAFQNPLVAAIYVVVNILLSFHLYHGLWSMFQSLGIDHPAVKGLRRPFAATFAVVICLGFIAIPISIVTGLIQ